MTNDELKKKISEIALTELQVQFGCGDTVEVGDREACAESIADALIAAGIGDVKDAEYRAEKAEQLKNQYCRALLNLARRYVVKTNMTLPHGNEPHSRSTDIEMLALYIIANECEQAEKELAEENGEKKEV